ncbi:MAG TPA: crotonyl-CoA carboxylase/reductase [Planctomycetota bacterium]|nr:crotonyl-CoA carboxylase/reductase [Planctomycetota bacterium]
MPASESIPETMAAQVIRRERYGPPRQAFQPERLAVPRPGPGEVLVRVMAAGVNPNGVYAALGHPLDVIAAHQRDGVALDHHVTGSDASGVVAATGPGVQRVHAGDAVVLHGGVWDLACEHVRAGGDPALSPSMRAWGYETPWGSFAEYALAQEHQCLPKPARLSWEEAAAFMICAATVWRMLRRWEPHVVQPGDLVLVWGGAGGLGCQAIQIVNACGGRAVAVVSSEERAAFCAGLGAVGCVDRRRFSHWGRMPDVRDVPAHAEWLREARRFRDAVREAGGGRDLPRIVLEHPGEDTLATSVFTCAPGGMVVTCAGTSGYAGSFDLRTAWVLQKRLQGSHGMNDADAAAVLALVEDGRLQPCVGRVYRFDEVALAHQLLHENRQPPGHLVVLIGAVAAGLGRTAS